MSNRQEPFRYITIDQVNAAAAEVLAAQHDFPLESAEPRDVLRLENEQASVILDWDCLPAEDRNRVLNSQALQVVAVHGYHFPDSIASFLTRRGVLLLNQLSPQMFARLSDLAAA